jgi:serine/threonine-protein kinase
MKKADHESLTGRTIAGKFVIEDLIGSGAMGAVFRARQVSLEKAVAIKVLHGEHAADPAFAARFQREAKAASRLNHPNSIHVLDFGAEPDGLLYIAMEYLDGRSLHRVLREEWPLAAPRVADIVMQTLAALAVAHDLGIVHRDLKPENVMVLAGTDDDGNPRDIVKVCDFGIAKITDPRAYRVPGERESEAPVTTAGYLVGTPEYMSPEQGRGEKLDHRSDLYSVGVILYEMLTKRAPFDAENAIGIVLKHITEEPALPSKLVPGIDPRLEAVAMRALKKFREERYTSAREMRADLRAISEMPGMTPVPELVAPPANTAALVNAATVAMPVPVSLAAVPPQEPAAPKPTLHGTAAPVQRPAGRHRGLVLAGVVVSALIAGSAGTAMWVKGRAHARPQPYAPVVVPPLASMVPLAPAGTTTTTATATHQAAPVVAPSPPATVADAPARPLTTAAPAASVHGRTPVAAAVPTATGKAPPPAASVSAASAVIASPSASPADSAAPTAVAIASASPPVPPAAAPAPDPDFDPERAYVEIGMINGEGVRERAVRTALHGAALSQCYKSNLRAKGSRSTGVATLNVSFDENGAARSAVLTGADFLPGLARCVQDVASGVHVGKASVDQGGGVAEVTIGFREP